MDSINQYAKKYQKRKIQDDNRNEIRIERWKWFVAIFSLCGALITISIILIDKLGINDLHCLKDGLISDKGIMFIFVCIMALIIIALSQISDNHIIKKLQEQKTDISDVMNIFDERERKIMEVTSQLNGIVCNLKQAPISNLITWSTSKQIENDAKKVWAFSYSLFWLTNCKFNRTYEILDELSKIENKDNEYFYILFDPENYKMQTIKDIRKIIDDFDKLNNTMISNRFVLKRFTKSNQFFPIPNDIAIYQSYSFDIKGDNLIGKDAVVINTQKDHKDDSEYDIIFNDEEHVKRIIRWFDNIWTTIK